jgi:O-antigen ligase
MKLSIEKAFATFSLLFFTSILEFKSLFTSAEGLEVTSNSHNPLTPLLSLIQHSIFLTVAFLILARWKSSIHTVVLRNKFIFLFVFLLISLFCLSFLWSDYPDETLRRCFALLETSIFGIYLASRFTIKEQLKLLVWALGIAIVVSVAFTLGVPAAAIEHGLHQGAWRGPIEHKNYFGRLMTLSTIVFATAEPKSRQHSILLKIGFFFSLVLVILSTSKTALAASVYLWMVVLPMYKSMQWNLKPKAFRTVTIFQAIVILIGGCGLIFIASSLDTIAIKLGRDLTLTGRTSIWLAVIEKLREQPFLGYGYYGFWNGLDGPSADVIKEIGGTYIIPHSHNGFIELTLASGGVGVTIFTIGFLLVARKSFINVFWGECGSDDLWPALYLTFLIVYNLTENTLVANNSIFWIIYISLAVSSFSKRSNIYFQKKNHVNLSSHLSC